MLAPLSWLKEYVDIKMSPSELGERLTEVGLGCEKITKTDGDVIFEFEITPNRPDLLSIVGIAREIAAIVGKPIRYPKLKTNLKPSSHLSSGKVKLPFTIHNNFNLIEHYTSVVIANITIKESPDWLKKRLLQLNLRPINNVVDITNYVMFELGIPLHAFDYDEIHGHEFFVEKAKGGEKFASVDNLSYSLPKDTIIINDMDRLVDLVGIKGGLNSGIKNTTKNILLQTSSDNSILIRRTSQALSLRSDASAILERGVDKNGMIPALSRAANLIFEIAGGEIASKVYDLKKESFEPWKLTLRISRLNKILGIEIDEKKIIDILASLSLNPHVKRSFANAQDDNAKKIECAIPTYRNDLKIEEDLIEEVARLYGYNNFPKTMPIGQIPTKQVPYFKDYRRDEKAKQILRASGFSEIYTYSLTTEGDLRVDNPVSREFEYLRPTLKSNLTKALLQNKPYFKEINLFELGKVYLGKTVDKAKECYFLSGISNSKSFYEIKGILERLFEELEIKEDPGKAIEVIDEGVFFEVDFSHLISSQNSQKVFISLPKYPPLTEDITIIAPARIQTGELLKEIQKQSKLIVKVTLLDQFEDTKTFHIIYQDPDKNLSTDDISPIRKRIFTYLKEKFGARIKE